MDTFVENWNIIQVLGEGAFGEVKLLVHQGTGDAVAMKVVDLSREGARESVKKEEKLHRLLVHDNVIRLLGVREDGDVMYMFLEYASGGELFNKIEPDVGMSSADAQRYMKELLTGLKYLHVRGIAHRDIKPENLLLNEFGTLKICDFGMATVFRLKGKERLLNTRCGTLPYVAPEVLKRPYKAEPADLWSCGVVFVAMLAGELPWDAPKEENTDFWKWTKDTYITEHPWSKLSNSAISLARKILTPEPKNRPNLEQILQHSWMQTKFSRRVSRDSTDGSKHDDTLSSELESEHETPAVTLSQPVPAAPKIKPGCLAALLKNRELVYFSQPTQNEDLIVSSQIQNTQSPLTQNNFQRLIKRMTRIFVKTSYEKTISQLCRVLDKLHYTWSTDASGVVTISTIDTRKMPLVFKANIIDMDGKLLLDFRLGKGCGLEFKKRFMKIKNSLSDIIINVNNS